MNTLEEFDVWSKSVASFNCVDMPWHWRGAVANTPEEFDAWIKKVSTPQLQLALLYVAEMIVTGEATEQMGLEPEERMRRYAVEIDMRERRGGNDADGQMQTR